MNNNKSVTTAEIFNRPLVYLAVPYSHENPKIRAMRFEAANIAAALLLCKGELVYSPISHNHPIAEASDLPRGWDFWEQYDRAFLSHCHKLVVLKLHGWTNSVGVQAEIKIAIEMNIPIEYLEAG